MAGGGRVCLGQIGAPHGVRGEVRLHSFTAEPRAIAEYGPLEMDDGGILKIESLRPAKDHFVATLAGVHDRNAAERLTNARLYVPRERLPELKAANEYYHADLIGLSVVDRSGKQLGTVVAIHNFGAGDLLEVRLQGSAATQMLPFDAASVPEVDLAAERVVVDVPDAVQETPPRSREGPTAKPSGGG
jgi:16S rRNA processing protein RimM